MDRPPPGGDHGSDRRRHHRRPRGVGRRLERSGPSSLTYFGDFTSVYLAILYGTDPTPVAAIEELKGMAEAAG